jgi:hypothetical protein
MTWFPIGPDFVYTPRDTTTPARSSRRNQWARQGRVVSVAVDPNAPNNIYTADSVTYPGLPRGGTAVFATSDGGQSWTRSAGPAKLGWPRS